MFQAFIDESVKGDLFVMAGYLATTEKWAAFSDKWAELLKPPKPTKFPPLRCFKMRQMNKPKHRERCGEFNRVIENHVIAGVSYTISVGQLRKLVAETFPGMRTKLEDPYHHALTGIVRAIGDERHQFGIDGPVDFIFDEARQKGKVLAAWSGFQKSLRISHPEAAKFVSSTPIFRDDETTMPLQAADLIAWWIREWQKNGIAYTSQEFAFPWPTNRRVDILCVAPTEDDVRSNLEQVKALYKKKAIASSSSAGTLES